MRAEIWTQEKKDEKQLFRRKFMKNPKHLLVIFVVVLVAAVIAAPAAHGQNIMAESTFDVNDEGWTMWDSILGGPLPVIWSSAGGHPGGHIYLKDPSGGSFAFRAPAKFLGDMTCAFNGTISRDLKTDHFDPGGRDMGLSIYGTGNIAIWNTEHMNVLNTWVTSVWTLNKGGGWTFRNILGIDSPATNDNILQVLHNVTVISIWTETIVGMDETTRLDNVRITCGVPDEYPDDIKWSQPPVEVNEGIINGWDEVSIIDSNSNCWSCPTQCHGDADCDGYVGAADSTILVAAYNTHYGDPNYNPCADFDRDGDVDTNDQQIMMAYWGTNPPGNCPSARAIVADDWICMDDRPITDIHWWGSFKGWTMCVLPDDKPNAFRLGIWTDVPDPNKRNPGNFSHPGKLVWEKVCSCYTWSYAGYDLDPRGIDQNEACFKFDQLLSQDEWFHQDSNDSNGTVYWLSIAAVYDGNTPAYPWGWKTRPHFYNDDAVRITDINDGSWPPKIGKSWASGQPIEYPAGTSWDLAFVLTANRMYPPRRGYWPPTLANSITTPLSQVDFNGDLIINFKDFAVFAGYWLTEGQIWPEFDLP
jgi:hypothetical protein